MMNIRKRQKLISSAKWWRYNRKYWTNWALEKVKKQAAIYDEFFNRTKQD